jgi:hypothetical protein
MTLMKAKTAETTPKTMLSTWLASMAFDSSPESIVLAVGKVMVLLLNKIAGIGDIFWSRFESQ